jgi:hypothetical protein
MNEMELLWERAQETPLPAAAELGAARARLVAAIAADPAAGRVAAEAEVTMQPYPTTGQVVEPPRPPAPAPVLTAVKFMHAGAISTAAYLIITLAFSWDVKAYHLRVLGHQLTTAQLSHWRPLIITVVMVGGLAVIAVWLWMARANGQGRNWARILSTVLFALATLQLRHPQPQGSPAGLGGTVLYYGDAVLFVAAWLVGAAAVWLLWRPDSSAFFSPRPPFGLTG